jgi:hypothetical protein
MKVQASLQRVQVQLDTKLNSLNKMEYVEAKKLELLKKEQSALALKKAHLEMIKDTILTKRWQAAKFSEDAYARKTASIRLKQDEDDKYIQQSAEQIRNIIADLQKENIKIDIQKDWFGLDNNQVVVNGKNMSAELHDKFKGRYIKPNGWGYYYGPVQVTGRGIFMDYQNIVQGK